MAGAPEDNDNAQKWSLEKAKALFSKAIVLSNQKDGKIYTYDFIGEVARELETYHDVFTYLSKTYKELEDSYKQLKRNLEANCFSNTKKGNIREAIGIVNLKSNYKWTDRIDQTTKGEKTSSEKVTINFRKKSK